jgi:hypothetical protein
MASTAQRLQVRERPRLAALPEVDAVVYVGRDPPALVAQRVLVQEALARQPPALGAIDVVAGAADLPFAAAGVRGAPATVDGGVGAAGLEA